MDFFGNQFNGFIADDPVIQFSIIFLFIFNLVFKKYMWVNAVWLIILKLGSP